MVELTDYHCLKQNKLSYNHILAHKTYQLSVKKYLF